MSGGPATGGPVRPADTATGRVGAPGGSGSRGGSGSSGRIALVSVESPAPRHRWHDLVVASDRALPEHAPEWTDAICAAGRYRDVSRHYLFDDGTDVVLPLVARRGLAGTGGWAASYPPAWGIGGPVGPALTVEHARTVLRDLRSLGYQQVGIRPDPLDGPVWEAAARAESVLTIPRRAHVLDLSGGLDAAWAGLSKTARRNVRQARSRGALVEVAHGGRLLDEYYRLYLSSVDRWAQSSREPRVLARSRALHRDPLSKLRLLGHHMGEEFSVCLVRLDDAPVAGAVVLRGRTAHTTRSAMDKDAIGASHAGVLAGWTEIELACEAGCPVLHLGETGTNQELARSKEKWGARPHEYVELRLERLPWTSAAAVLRSGVKRAIGFRDA